MNSNKNKISRADFLKTSVAAFGGVVTLSHYACSGDMNSLKEMIIQGKTNSRRLCYCKHRSERWRD